MYTPDLLNSKFTHPAVHHKLNIYKLRPFLPNPTPPSKNVALLLALPILVNSTSNLRLKSFLNILLLGQVAVSHIKKG